MEITLEWRQGGRMRKGRQMIGWIKQIWNHSFSGMLTMQLSVFAWPAQTMPGLQNRNSGNVFIQVWSSTTGTVMHFRCCRRSSVSKRRKVGYYSDSFRVQYFRSWISHLNLKSTLSHCDIIFTITHHSATLSLTKASFLPVRRSMDYFPFLCITTSFTGAESLNLE